MTKMMGLKKLHHYEINELEICFPQKNALFNTPPLLSVRELIGVMQVAVIAPRRSSAREASLP